MNDGLVRRSLLGFCVSLIGLATSSSARTWHVFLTEDGDAPTIQAAIDRSSHGDVVLVGPGKYYVNLNLRGKQIHLKSEVGPEATILDGSLGDSSVVMCLSGETNRTVIDGFTITGGRGSPRTSAGARWGGGILCIGSSPVIRGNIIRENRVESPDRYTQSWAGGILFELNPDPVIVEDNLIEDNFAWTNGGGIMAGGPCVIQRNVIRGNSTRYGDGGGLYIARTKNSVYRDNVIVENEAGDHGGGIYVINIDPASAPASGIEIAGNLIAFNRSRTSVAVDCSGGGIWVVGTGAHIHHNTIAFNRSESLRFPAGGGVCLVDTRVGMVVEYNLVYHNNEGGVVAYRWSTGAWHALIRRNLIYDNGPHDFYNKDPGMFTLILEENVFADPMLCMNGPGSQGEVAGMSPALNQPWGSIGAVSEPGCGPSLWTTTEKMSWGAIKARYGP